MDILYIAVGCGFFSLGFSLVFAIALHWFRNRTVDGQLSDFEARMEAAEMSIRGAVGRDNREIKNERLQMAIAEGMAIIQSKDGDQGDKLKALLNKYPDVALNAAKKLGIKF